MGATAANSRYQVMSNGSVVVSGEVFVLKTAIR